MADPNIATPVIVPGLRGGSTSQILKKNSNTDFDYGWEAGYLETVEAIGNSGTTKTLNGPASGTMKTVTLNNNCTFTMPSAVAGESFSLEMTQDGTGSRIPTFTGVRWTGGSMPVASTAASAIDVLAFACFDGTHWEGVQVAKGLA